jgi:tetratricopeptide (TPR) repeat protein
MKDSVYYYQQGIEFINNNDLKNAINSFKESLRIDEHFKTYEKLSEVLRIVNENDEADECIKKAYNLNSNSDKTSVLYAEILIRKGKIDDAIIILRDTLKRNSSYKKARELLDKL